MIKNLSKLFEPKDFKVKYMNYMKLINDCSNDEDKVKTVKSLLAVVTEYLNFDEAIQAIETSHEAQNNSLIEKLYDDIVEKMALSINEILCQKIHPDDMKYYENKIIREQGPIEIEVNELPILLNPWNPKRIVQNLEDINDQNSFNGKRFSHNIENHYLYPMDIVVCNGANHSQFAARMHNQGKTLIKQVRNYSSLYEYVYFDGISYKKMIDHSTINLGYNKKTIYYSGVIFELGRYLYDIGYHRFLETRNQI